MTLSGSYINRAGFGRLVHPLMELLWGLLGAQGLLEKPTPLLG